MMSYCHFIGGDVALICPMERQFSATAIQRVVQGLSVGASTLAGDAEFDVGLAVLGTAARTDGLAITGNGADWMFLAPRPGAGAPQAFTTSLTL